MSRCRRFLFTLQTHDNFEEEQDALVRFSHSVCKYFNCQAELAPTTHQRHIQGWFVLQQPKSLTAVIATFHLQEPSLRPHVEICKGTPQSNEDYVMKSNTRDTDTPFTYSEGDPPRPGKRKDLDSLVQAIKDDDKPTKVRKVIDEVPSVVARYPKFVNTLRALQMESFHYTDHPLFYIFYGPTGTGKTRFAHSLARTLFDEVPFTHITSTRSRPWFDGYDGHSLVLFDEFDNDSLSIAWLKRLTDRYIINVEVKGAVTPWYPRVIVLCSNLTPIRGTTFFQSAYPGLSDADCGALVRRLTLAVDTSMDGWERLLFPLPLDVSTLIQRR